MPSLTEQSSDRQYLILIFKCEPPGSSDVQLHVVPSFDFVQGDPEKGSLAICALL